MTVTPENHSVSYASFQNQGASSTYIREYRVATSSGRSTRQAVAEHDIAIEFFVCPECEKQSISVKGNTPALKDIHVPIVPIAEIITLPDYIPEPIAQDYVEACAILPYSPKASATLSRRCLQGMVRNFWKAEGRTLADEIRSIEKELSPDVWKAIDSMRSIGNIGAHMEKDVNLVIDVPPHVAKLLVQMLEYLFKEWYINRHESQVMQQMIFSAASEIKDAKNPDHP